MNTNHQTRVVLALASVLALCVAGTASAATFYVRFGGTGDGSSWANASSLQDAINSASVLGDEIWVAAGTYIPSVQLGGEARTEDECCHTESGRALTLAQA